MRTDAKDLALGVFQRQKERCIRLLPVVDPQPKESTCCEDAPPASPSPAAQGSMATKVYNNELTHLDLGIEELREKKDKIRKVMHLEEEEKANIQRELAALATRMAAIDESLRQKYAYVEEYDKTIQEVESAYRKILESSQALLHVLKTENSNQVPQSAR